MFNTITRKTNEAKAVVGATVATIKEIRKERKEIIAMITSELPGLSKWEREQYYYQLSGFRVGEPVKN